MKPYIEPEEVDLLEEAATCLRDKLLIRVLFRTGIRVSEAVGLELADVDLGDRLLRIQHLKARVRLECPECGARLGKSHRFCPGCGKKVDTPRVGEEKRRKMRVIPLDRGTQALLEKYIQLGGPVERDGRILLFGIARNTAWGIVRECAWKAGLGRLINPDTGKPRGISPHRLRDAFAVMAVQRDDSTDGIRMLQEQLGHANIGTTMRYRKVAGQELREWYERLWQEDNGHG